MKRVTFMGILTAFLILWQPGSADLAQEKVQAPTSWKTVSDFKVLRLWEEPSFGPKEPQIALLQLSADRQKELACDPLAFYKKYDIFKPHSDLSKGQFVVQLGNGGPKYASSDPYIVVVVHDSHTYSGSASFGVDQIH